mmetsp:Transcript_18310/g.14815  ORF Transcript_18310/g.14815 Transcript_18310/m.14815 type:complete len:82 (+) Transcript_18310:122-367(+)
MQPRRQGPPVGEGRMVAMADVVPATSSSFPKGGAVDGEEYEGNEHLGVDSLAGDKPRSHARLQTEDEQKKKKKKKNFQAVT